jgi:hypothetical protein
LVSPAFADDHGKQDGCISSEWEIVNCGDNGKEGQAGIGADVKVYKFKDKFLDSIEVQARKDFIDIDRWEVYTVLKVDLTKE